MIPEHRHRPEENVDSWLMTYADLITLLMCFFIIFVSVSEPRKERISAITDGMAGKFGTVDLSTPFQGTYQSLLATIQKHRLLRDIAVTKNADSIEMELASDSFFEPGSADITPDKLQALAEMAAAIKQVDFLDYNVIVEGHTNDLPPATAAYPTNWELSAARATRLVRFFIEQGIRPKDLKAVGYGDTRPAVPNLDHNGHAIPENRARNQRVVIKLERVK